jgi:hypothetical protein
MIAGMVSKAGTSVAFVGPDDVKIVETCPGCGAQFICCPAGDCWCGREAFRMPLPALGYDAACYCPTCLQKLAQQERK